MAHRLWNPPRLHQRGEMENEHRVTWLELFYDLVYVATLIQLGNLLSHDVTPLGIARFVVLFVPIWWAWTGITFYLNRFVVDDVPHRLLILAQICAIVWLGASVEGAYGELARQFALSYAAVRIVLLLLYVRTWRTEPGTKPLTRRYVGAFGIGIVLWLVSAFVPQPYNVALWLVALAVEIGNVFLPQTRARLSLLPPDPPHMMERYGIFTLIVLGEAFIKTISSASGLAVTAPALIFSVLAITVVFGLWWLYFDGMEETAIARTHWAPYVWIYSHLPLAIGLTAAGVATTKLFLGAGESHVKPAYLLLFCGAMMLYALAVGLMDWVTFRRDRGLTSRTRAVWRAGMFVAFGLIALFGQDLSPLAFIALAAAVLAVQVGAEVVGLRSVH
jgi:low temperature requirement protein LtrA